MSDEKVNPFSLVSTYEPCGDQPQAIESLVKNYHAGQNQQVLLGVTGSGKTFTMANVIARLNQPALIMVHNKTLAAQLYYEFRELFPKNAVEYFVSYYDYYQPEAYIPTTDTYIEKDSAINEQIEKLRYSATRSILERQDTIVVASVSCIYGLGSPDIYKNMIHTYHVGQEISRQDIIRHLVAIQYARNDIDFKRNTFRVRGDILDIFPPYEEDTAERIIFWGDEIEEIVSIDQLTGELKENHDKITIFPASHYVAPEERIKVALETIEEEMECQVEKFKEQGKLLEAQRLEQRTRFDLEQLELVNFCKGIENYSRHLDGRAPGQPPATLLDYFPGNFIVFVDESHQTLPQVRAMYNGDRMRKSMLVEHGFRLPSALDNRPLTFDEFNERIRDAVYVSATPAEYEKRTSNNVVVEQIVRPTGLLDPAPEIRPAKNQVQDLYGEIKKEISRGYRILVTVMTKRFAEDLTSYYEEMGLKVKYLHSDIDTIERTIILSDLREGVFDVLIGINLLREGLDIPEVSLVGIIDADKEGFLRDYRSLIQTAGRAARNVDSRVILYADKKTDSIERAVQEMLRRREKQEKYNKEHYITPRTIKKNIHSLLETIHEKDYYTPKKLQKKPRFKDEASMEKHLYNLQQEMLKAARNMEFEEAARIRDELKQYLKLEDIVLKIDE